MRNQRGVGQAEIVITMLVICVLVAVVAAGYLAIENRAERSACETSRTLIARLYNAHHALDADCTLQEALNGECDGFASLTNGHLTCPSGAAYTVSDDGVILCDRHGE